MGKRQVLLFFIVTIICGSLSAREIVVGVERIPKRKVALIFTPLVLTELISAKLAVEYRLHDKLNLIIPIEGKWMDYRWAIRLIAGSEYPEKLYRPEESDTVIGMNIDFAQFKLSTGLGVKYFPFSESMTNAFYLKTLALIGGEHFYDYRNKVNKNKNSAVYTHVLTMGYNWVLGNRFTWGMEGGVEYIHHFDPIKNLPPILISGFNPIFQFNFGFTF